MRSRVTNKRLSGCIRASLAMLAPLNKDIMQKRNNFINKFSKFGVSFQVISLFFIVIRTCMTKDFEIELYSADICEETYKDIHIYIYIYVCVCV